MRTIHVTRFGGPDDLELREAPAPTPRADEVLIDVEVVEIIFLDTQLRAGWGEHFFPMRPPFVPGTGVAGTIRGGDRDGQRVVARTGDEGGYAEQVVVPGTDAFVIPLAGGDVRPTIGQRVPFAEVRRAHEAIAGREIVGKSVLVV